MPVLFPGKCSNPGGISSYYGLHILFLDEVPPTSTFVLSPWRQRFTHRTDHLQIMI